MKRRRLSYEKMKSMAGYEFISLWLIGVVVFFLFPFIEAVRYSFSNITINPGEVILEWVGWQNYEHILLEDTKFLPAFVSTLTSVVVKTPLVVLFSLFIAIILNQKFRGRTFFRAIFFLPVIISSGVVISFMNNDSLLTMLMNGSRSSMMFELLTVKELLDGLGLGATISDYVANLVNEIFNLTWYSGIQILIFLAGSQSISPSLYEVSKVEGATPWDDFWKVTIPMIAPMILVNFLYTIIDNFINYSNPVFAYIQEVQGKIDFASASSMALLSFVVAMILVGIVFAIMSRRIHYVAD